MSELYAVTVNTGGLESLARCAAYMARQRSRPDVWVIVDYGLSTTDIAGIVPDGLKYAVVRPSDSSDEFPVVTALRVVPDYADVCIFSCNAWYSPFYLAGFKTLFRRHALVTSDTVDEYDLGVRAHRRSTDLSEVASDLVCFGFTSAAREGVEAVISRPGLRNPLVTAVERLAGFRAPQAVPYSVAMCRDVVHSGDLEYDEDDPGWHPDPDCVKLHGLLKEDIHRYYESDGRVYIFSNVLYPESRKVAADPRDILVFLNKASSIGYYDDHPNKYVYHRSPKPSYGEERLNAYNRYVYSGGDVGIPEWFTKDIRKTYDWDYTIDDGSIRSSTTGYVVAKYIKYAYPLRTVVLVNFGYDVRQSTYRCPWHNWAFEHKELSSFEHMFTAETGGGDNPDLVKLKRAERASIVERHLAAVFTAADCDQMVRHDYGEVYAKYISAVRDVPGDVAVVIRSDASLANALAVALPGRRVYGILPDAEDITRKVDGVTLIDGTGYSPGDWEGIPRDLSLIVDDGSHKADDIIPTIPLFLEHLAPDGFLLIEDVPSEEAVDALLGALPGAVCHRTTPVSPYSDDRVLAYSRAGLSGDLRLEGPERPVRTGFAGTVDSVFREEGSDRVLEHDYADVFAIQLGRLVGRKSKVLEIGRADNSGLRALRRLLPDADIYSISDRNMPNVAGVTMVRGDGYSHAAWKGLPRDFDLVIDDGSHDVEDIRRGRAVFRRHLKSGGVLLVEDIPTEQGVRDVIKALKRGMCYRTLPISSHNDDRIVVYTK